MKKQLIFVAAVLFGSTAASAGPFTSMIDFGDSLSDVGNDFKLVNTPAGPGYYNGRFSNGPIWLEKLGPALGLPIPTASLNGGSDYAYGGVTSGAGYSNFILPNVQTQITTWTSKNTATNTQLFTVLGGANDLFNNLSTETGVTAADNISADVGLLYADGARNILVGNLPDLGKTPKYLNGPSQNVASMSTLAFNTELAMDLSTLSTKSPGLNLYNLDLYTLFNNVIANPGNYGLTDVTDAAYTGDNTFAGNGTAVANPGSYLFWDTVHPTTAAGTLVSQTAVAAIPEPASVAMVAGTLALRSRRRRQA